ncbi:MAG: single-stranded DNA-binding protein [Nocardioides sp.]
MNETNVSFSGWVGTEVSITETSAGEVATFRIGSTPRRLVRGVWQNDETNWFTVKAWRQLAVNAHQSIRQGDPVVVNGRLTSDVWERTDGQRSTRNVVVATSLGHDLSHGTSDFSKVKRVRERTDESVKQVIHSYEDSGPHLDADGEVVGAESPAA